jgi:hypothetical protein
MFSSQILELPKIIDIRGNLTFLQYPQQIPFEIKRVFWTYDVPGGQTRGGHAYRTQQEIIIALSGSFDVVVTKGNHTLEKYTLNRSYYGILLPALTWRHMENFSTNAVALHITDKIFNAEEYIREFDEYINDSQ